MMAVGFDPLSSLPFNSLDGNSLPILSSYRTKSHENQEDGK
jgi:hypothetical protein